jgi:hypothetical protein
MCRTHAHYCIRTGCKHTVYLCCLFFAFPTACYLKNLLNRLLPSMPHHSGVSHVMDHDACMRGCMHGLLVSTEIITLQPSVDIHVAKIRQLIQCTGDITAAYCGS